MSKARGPYRVDPLRYKKANEALDKKADNARELGLDYEPVWGSGFTNKDYEDAMRQRRLHQLTSPPAQHGWTTEQIARMARLKEAQDKKLSQPEQEPVAWADECRIELVNAIHFLASDFENALGAFGGDIEARRKAEGDIAHARSVASRWNWNGTSLPAQQEPVAWMHVMDNTEGIKANGKGHISITQKRKHPFGKPGVDFSKSYPVTSTPLYTSPPAQRTWVGLVWGELPEDGHDHDFLRGAVWAEAKLREKNT